jgi:putative DNA primase/helicase
MPREAVLTLDELLLHLGQTWPEPNGWKARCPAHEDSSPSLAIAHGRDGRILLKCRAGCSFRDVCTALGIQPNQLGPAPDSLARDPTTSKTYYDYTAADGTLIYQVVRFQGATSKDFKQRRPDGAGWIWKLGKDIPRLPYRLPQLQGHSSIYIVEGEKDVESMWARNLPATCNSGGAGKWRDAETQAIKTLGVKRVVILPDNDAPGRKHAEDVARLMKANGIAFTIVELPGLRHGEDVSDWFANGHQVEELETLAAKPYVIQADAAPRPALDRDADLKERRRKTPVGQAELFAELYGGEFRFNHFLKLWLHFESPCWRPDTDMAVYRAALDYVRRQQQVAFDITDEKRMDELRFTVGAERSTAMHNLIEAATWNITFKDNGQGWDLDPWALAVNNGVVDLRTGVLRPGAPSDRITMKCTAAYRPDSECPGWWKFLSEIFNGDVELVEFVWRLCGYILTGETTERIVPMFYGRGANGKSVFLNVLATIMGDYATALPFSSLQFQKQEGIPNDLASLVGRRLVTMIEANDGLRLNEAKLKTLSGNDRISARFLHGEFFTFQPVAKFVLAMNHKPIAKDDSPGFWDRIRLVPFLHTFPAGQRDEGLQKRLLKTEADGILTWAVNGCLRWQESGLTTPAAVVDATAEYQADSDQLREFLAICCSTDDENAVTGASAIQKAYNSYADHRGLNKYERLSTTALGRLLGERFPKKRTPKGIVYCGLHVFSHHLFD